MAHPAQPLLDRYRTNLAAGLSPSEAMCLAMAGKVHVKLDVAAETIEDAIG